jgi:uncharacterized repeat protein (TIGR03806 family)
VSLRLAALFSLAAALGCGGSSQQKPCTPGGDGSYLQKPYDSLSQYCMIQLKDGAVQANAGVNAYDLNTPLFSDYAVKTRTVWLPAGKAAAYDATNVFDFPVGTVFTKSFGFRDDFRKAAPVINWVETRVLFRSDAGWQGYAYIWNSGHTEAQLDYGGQVRAVGWLDDAGAQQNVNYLIPSFNQCKQCHLNDSVMSLIGPKARNLNRSFSYSDGSENQLARWSRLGLLTGAPDPALAPKLAVWSDPATGTVEQRARAYLETNCAHCHSATGAAGSTGLFLLTSETNQTHLGVCKQPVAAGEASGGLYYDVVPGQPDQSIIPYRMNSTQPGSAMPQIGRAAVDTQGLALIKQWITGLSGACH